MVALLDVGFLAGVILLTHFLLHGDTKIDVIGFLCAGLNIVMYASPLAAMVRNSIGLLLIIIDFSCSMINNSLLHSSYYFVDLWCWFFI